MVSIETTGTIFNIQKFSVHDGPGIRTTVFMKGCPLRCKWCSNAESMFPEPEPGIIRSSCTLCGACFDACPQAAISIVNDEIRIDRDLCNACGSCVKVCSPGAITIYGREITVSEVLKEVMKDKDFYTGSNGGVTVSGGEPLRQPDFVTELFSRCKEEGIGTCLDTCGYAPSENLNAVLPYADFILFDLKVMDGDAHKYFTGVDNTLIQENARKAVKSDSKVLFRIPLIDGVNADEENLIATAEFIVSLERDCSVELLPYHKLGIGKYKTLDRIYPGSDLKTPDSETIEKITKLFTEHGVSCSVGG